MNLSLFMVDVTSITFTNSFKYDFLDLNKILFCIALIRWYDFAKYKLPGKMCYSVTRSLIIFVMIFSS